MEDKKVPDDVPREAIDSTETKVLINEIFDEYSSIHGEDGAMQKIGILEKEGVAGVERVQRAIMDSVKYGKPPSDKESKKIRSLLTKLNKLKALYNIESDAK